MQANKRHSELSEFNSPKNSVANSKSSCRPLGNRSTRRKTVWCRPRKSAGYIIAVAGGCVDENKQEEHTNGTSGGRKGFADVVIRG